MKQLFRARFRVMVPALAALTLLAVSASVRAADGPPAPPAFPTPAAADAPAAPPSTNAFVKLGDKVLAFETKTTDGKTVKFPEDYKGKVVLLDFWASWCPDCRNVLPDVVSNYGKYHAKGFEILSISLDRTNGADALAKFTQAHKMPWPEVYDGKFRQAAIAMQYNVRTIPHVFLVDGNTGLIIDDRDNVSAATIEKALSAKGIKSN